MTLGGNELRSVNDILLVLIANVRSERSNEAE